MRTSQSTNKMAANDLTDNSLCIDDFQCEYWKCNKKILMRGVEGDAGGA